jgi:hypothetical protein
MSGEPKKRAARIPAPGAPRVTFEGYVTVPDDFGRLRFLLPPREAAALRRAVPAPPGGPPPGLAWRTARGLPVDVALDVPVVPDARRRAFWHAAAAAARGRWARVEVTARRYAFGAAGGAPDFADLGPAAGAGGGGGGAPGGAVLRAGTAFDLVFFEEAPEPRA